MKGKKETFDVDDVLVEEINFLLEDNRIDCDENVYEEEFSHLSEK
jgi:hypothetical protein